MLTAPTPTTVKPLDRALLRELKAMVEDFNTDYAEVLDRGEIETWPDFFTEDGVYRLIARDNADANLPLSLMSCDGKGMLKDRAYAIAHTEMFAPRYVLHHISPARVTDVDGDVITARFVRGVTANPFDERAIATVAAEMPSLIERTLQEAAA